MAVSSSSCLSTASLTNSKSNISFDSSVSPFLRNVVFCSSILPSSHRRSMTVRSKIREIFMPALSSTMTEGKIVSWIKTKARNSQRERVLLLLNLIKPILMFETFYDGYLSAIIVGEGELVGAAIGLLAKTEAEIEEAKTNAASKSSSSAPEAVVPSPPPVMFHSSLVHQVPEGHVGAYWRGGALLNIITEPGFHLKLPFITNYEPVQVTLQTNQVKDIPCGTKGVVMISFEKIEVVNRLRKDAVYDTLLNYGVNYDNTWIYDKIHHEINQFCSAHSLQQVYIDIFDQLIVHVTPAIEIISVRVTKATKPKIPESVRRNFEQMEEERTKVLIAIEKQTIAEKEAETKKMMAISEAEKNANVSKILMQQKLTEKNSLRREADIENLMYLDRQKSLADADYYRYIRLIVVEVLRLYPQPPLLIRRTLKAETLPGGYKGEKSGHKVPKGTDIFISVYNLHRSPYFWDNPHEFKPEKFLRTKESNGIEGWAGIDRRTNYVVAEIRCGVGWTAGIS